MAIDFSSIGGVPVNAPSDKNQGIDFSSIGGVKVSDAPPPSMMQQFGSAAKQGAVDALGAVGKTATAPVDAIKALLSVPPKDLYAKTKNYLPAAGGTIGMLGGPVGVAAGAGLGSILKQAGGVAFDDPETMKYVTPGENFNPTAGIKAGTEALIGGAGEVNGLLKAAPGAAPYAQRAVNAVGDALAPVGDAIKTGIAKTSQAFTGVPARQAVKLMNNPSTLVTLVGQLDSAGKAVEGAESAMGSKLPSQLEAAITTNQDGVADRIVTNLMAKAKDSPEAISTEEALMGIKSIDRTIPAPTRSNAPVLQKYYDLRSQLADVISQNEPAYAAAKSAYNDAKVGADFRNILPRTMTGNVSTVKTVLPMFLDLKRAGALPLTSPIVHGAAMAAGSAATKAAQFAITNPTARRSLISAYVESKGAEQ